MSRYTQRDEYGNADIIGVDSADLQLNLEFKEFNRVTDALNRLAAYEDTGLEPETCSEYKKFEDELVASGKTFRHVLDLLAAEKDGRLVAITPEQNPKLEWTKDRPHCFYTDKPSGYYCLGFCRGNDDDEPIDPCKGCWWLDENVDQRLEAEAALRGEEHE